MMGQSFQMERSWNDRTSDNPLMFKGFGTIGTMERSFYPPHMCARARIGLNLKNRSNRSYRSKRYSAQWLSPRPIVPQSFLHHSMALELSESEAAWVPGHPYPPTLRYLLPGFSSHTGRRDCGISPVGRLTSGTRITHARTRSARDTEGTDGRPFC